MANVHSPFPASPEHQYFLDIEILFNTLRGSASLLSPDDWQLARRWWDQGIPIHVVGAALENVFERRRDRGSERRVQSLTYCSAAVENAFQQLQELGYGDHEAVEEVRLADRLEALIQRLRPEHEMFGDRIRACADNESDAAKVEATLADLELVLAREILGSMPASEREVARRELETRRDKALEPLRARLAPGAVAQAARTLEGRLLKELTEVPRLTLFES